MPRFFTGFHAAQVGETFADVKLSDLGAARNVKSKEEYTYIATTEHLPARWLPLEAIRDAAFSHKSDVFSFGVCACGSFQPFPLSFSFIDPTMPPCWRYGCARTVQGANVKVRRTRAAAEWSTHAGSVPASGDAACVSAAKNFPTTQFKLRFVSAVLRTMRQTMLVQC